MGFLTLELKKRHALPGVTGNYLLPVAWLNKLHHQSCPQKKDPLMVPPLVDPSFVAMTDNPICSAPIESFKTNFFKF